MIVVKAVGTNWEHIGNVREFRGHHIVWNTCGIKSAFIPHGYVHVVLINQK